MRIYILPYTNKTYFSKSKRVSGIDASALSQLKALSDLGHDVRMWTCFGDLHEVNPLVDHYSEIDQSQVKVAEKKHRADIVKTMLESIVKHKPDLIYSNFEFSPIYQKLMNLNIPMIYNSHAVPGSWNDLNNANLLKQFLDIGNTFICVSDYHKMLTIKYYKNKRSAWNFTELEPDGILYPQYCNVEAVRESDGIVRHISAASKDKDTFLVHKNLEGSGIQSKVFTTLSFAGCKVDDPYIKDNIEKYKDSTLLDVPHSDIMNEIGSSSCSFVGNCPDTFTITSLEFLSRGVPILVKQFAGSHPAKEMIESELSKYVYIYKDKSDFVEKVKEFSKLSLEDRQQIAQSTFRMMNYEKYKSRMSDVLKSALKKYKGTVSLYV